MNVNPSLNGSAVFFDNRLDSSSRAPLSGGLNLTDVSSGVSSTSSTEASPSSSAEASREGNEGQDKLPGPLFFSNIPTSYASRDSKKASPVHVDVDLPMDPLDALIYNLTLTLQSYTALRDAYRRSSGVPREFSGTYAPSPRNTKIVIESVHPSSFSHIFPRRSVANKDSGGPLTYSNTPVPQNSSSDFHPLNQEKLLMQAISATTYSNMHSDVPLTNDSQPLDLSEGSPLAGILPEIMKAKMSKKEADDHSSGTNQTNSTSTQQLLPGQSKSLLDHKLMDPFEFSNLISELVSDRIKNLPTPAPLAAPPIVPPEGPPVVPPAGTAAAQNQSGQASDLNSENQWPVLDNSASDQGAQNVPSGAVPASSSGGQIAGAGNQDTSLGFQVAASGLHSASLSDHGSNSQNQAASSQRQDSAPQYLGASLLYQGMSPQYRGANPSSRNSANSSPIITDPAEAAVAPQASGVDHSSQSQGGSAGGRGSIGVSGSLAGTAPSGGLQQRQALQGDYKAETSETNPGEALYYSASVPQNGQVYQVGYAKAAGPWAEDYNIGYINLPKIAGASANLGVQALAPRLGETSQTARAGQSIGGFSADSNAPRFHQTEISGQSAVAAGGALGVKVPCPAKDSNSVAAAKPDYDHRTYSMEPPEPIEPFPNAVFNRIF
ncbi:uncharacterized protein LOC108864988 [Galendromus occidentalis]|uniref:Uncharacterized protein LOC108864988 n=1 Tax=Galendromus occidentalis TaxID=34638 RepID=A0AAJ7L682_9ACAR|nr:uncharacterized protein LOC108864988 [Galendromus occidentalis]